MGRHGRLVISNPTAARSIPTSDVSRRDTLGQSVATQRQFRPSFSAVVGARLGRDNQMFLKRSGAVQRDMDLIRAILQAVEQNPDPMRDSRFRSSWSPLSLLTVLSRPRTCPSITSVWRSLPPMACTFSLSRANPRPLVTPRACSSSGITFSWKVVVSIATVS